MQLQDIKVKPDGLNSKKQILQTDFAKTFPFFPIKNKIQSR